MPKKKIAVVLELETEGIGVTKLRVKRFWTDVLQGLGITVEQVQANLFRPQKKKAAKKKRAGAKK